MGGISWLWASSHVEFCAGPAPRPRRGPVRVRWRSRWRGSSRVRSAGRESRRCSPSYGRRVRCVPSGSARQPRVCRSCSASISTTRSPSRSPEHGEEAFGEVGAAPFAIDGGLVEPVERVPLVTARFPSRAGCGTPARRRSHPAAPAGAPCACATTGRRGSRRRWRIRRFPSDIAGPSRCSQPARPSASYSASVQKVAWMPDRFSSPQAWTRACAKASGGTPPPGRQSRRGPGTGENGTATCSFG